MPAIITCPVCRTVNPSVGDAWAASTCCVCGRSLDGRADAAAPSSGEVAASSDASSSSVDVLILDDSKFDAVTEGVSVADLDLSDRLPAVPGKPPSTSDQTIAMDHDDSSSSERRLRISTHDGPPGHQDGMPALPGTSKGGQKFVIIEELNRGGMGVVLRGRDRGLHREVAIKVIRDQDNGHQRARFIKEAQVTGQLEHPNIVPVHEFGVDRSGRMFFAMKLVRGRNLAEVLERHRSEPQAAEAEYPLTKLVGILIQVCNAIAFAHSRGVIHRDLKPANIMLGDFGEVMLMDWGLAKVGDPAAVGGQTQAEAAAAAAVSPEAANDSTRATVGRFDVTVDGAVIGTPAYMPPEQAAGQVGKMDARSDVYALGGILYEILTLHPPVSGGDLKEVLRKAMLGHIVAPERRAPARQIPRDLAAVAMKALSTDPDRRYASAGALRRDLENFLEGRAVSARTGSLVEALTKFVRRHRITSAAVALACVVLAVVMVSSYLFNVRERQRAQAERASALLQGERAEAESARARSERARAEAEAAAAERERQRATAESQAAQSERERAEQALRVADEQRRIAEVERQKSTAAFERELHQRELSDAQNHLASLALAGEQIGHAEFTAARASLEGCPAAYRDWVWRRLSLLCHQQLALFADHAEAANAVACSADGGRMVSVGGDGQAIVYDLRTRQRVARLKLHASAARGVAISADGEDVLTAGADTTVRLWRAGEPAATHVLFGHEGAATCVAFIGASAADGAVSGGEDGTVRLWDLGTGKQRMILGRLGEAVRSVAVIAGGQRIIAGGVGGAVVCWDAADGRQVASTRVPGAVLAAHGTGPRVLIAGPHGTAQVWDLAANAAVNTLHGHGREVVAACFSADGRRVVTGSLDSTARVWNAETGEAVVTLSGHGGRINGLCFASGDEQVLSASDDDSVRLWDARRRHDVRELESGPGLATIALSPDGARFVTGGSDGIGQLRDLSDLRLIAPLRHGAPILASAFSPDGRLVATAGGDGVCRLWDGRSGEHRVDIFCPPSAIAGLAFSPDNARILTASGDGRARVWDTADGHEEFTCHGHIGAVLAAAFSPDGRFIATSGADATIRLFKAHNGEALDIIPAHDSAVGSIAFAPDGRHLLSASEQVADVWDAASGEKTQILRGHTGTVARAAFSPDGTQALTASADGTACIWDVASGRALLVLREHQAPVVGIQFSANGRDLVTADSSGRIIVWAAADP